MPPYDSISHLSSMSNLSMKNLYSVSGKICLVTGASRGIGLMIAKGFVENGAKVYIVSRKKNVCEKVAAALNKIGPGSAVALAADLTTDVNCRKLAGQIAELESKLDVLVNNAGVTWGDSFENFPEKAWNRCMTLNVVSVFNLTRACVPLLKKASKGNLDPSHVINISSVAGTPSYASSFDNAPSYAASKAACNKVTQTLAAYLIKDSICVNCIAPAVFPSKMTYDYSLKTEQLTKISNKMHPVGRVGNEKDMAGLAIFLASKASAFMSGSIINLDGGLVAIRSAM